MFVAPDRRRIYLLHHAEAAYVDEQGTITDDPRMVPLTAVGSPARVLIRAINLTGYDLNKSNVHLTTMESTAARIAQQLDT